MCVEPAPMVAGSHMTLHKPSSVPRTLGDRTHNKPGEVRAAENSTVIFYLIFVGAAADLFRTFRNVKNAAVGMT